MTNEEFVKSLRGKKLKDLSPEQLNRVKAFVKNRKINREETGSTVRLPALGRASKIQGP